MRHSLKVRIKHAIPAPVLNACLLRYPSLYKTSLVFYESNLNTDGGVGELLQQLSLAQRLEGDVIECGSSRCGSSILMAMQLRQAGDQASKHIFACDSYEGFDSAELARERQSDLTKASTQAFTSTSFQYVQRKIEALGLQESVIPVKGYFQDSLPGLPGPFCFGLVDCDLKDSLVYSAEEVWKKLTPGGRIVFDDYTSDSYKGARLGVDEFVQSHTDEIAEHGLLNRLYYISKADLSTASR